MSDLTEATHDSPSPSAPYAKLVRVGSKHNATLPAVTDGDDVYLLLDAAGRVFIRGAVDSDAAAVGGPVLSGGVVDDTAPAAAAEADARSFRSTPEGNQIVELYKDNNALSPIAAMPGASEVKTAGRGLRSNTVAAASYVAPTAGKKIRILQVHIWYDHATALGAELFFHADSTTGTPNVTTDDTKAIVEILEMDVATQPNYSKSWPDGAGPVGAVNDDIAMRVNTAVSGSNCGFIIFYREE